jgi:hypothetical protein
MKLTSFTVANLREKWLQLRIKQLRQRHALPEVELGALLGRAVEIAPPILEQACMPPHYWKTDHDDFTPLMKLARALAPKVIVELGTAYGNTTANLCQNCPGARVFTVNAPLDLMTGVVTTFKLTREDIGSVYRQHGYGERVTQIFANTLDLDLAPHLRGEKIGLGIVDACHDIEYVINDFLKLLPHMAPGGIMLLHDTHPSMEDHLRGSYVAGMKLREQGHDIRHLRDTWWGIWRPDWQASL